MATLVRNLDRVALALLTVALVIFAALFLGFLLVVAAI
jgi:hypothetical protein